MTSEHPILTITCVVECKGEFLLIKRAETEKNYPGFWAFPGGRPHIGETAIDTVKREVKEETGLDVSSDAAFLDSYMFKNVIGIAFLVGVSSKDVVLSDEASEYIWIKTVEDMLQMHCIEGIFNHLKRALYLIQNNKVDNLEDMNLTIDKYINTNK